MSVAHGGDEKRRGHLTPDCVHCCLKLKVPIKMCALAVYDDIIYMRHPLHCSSTYTALHKCRIHAGCGNGWGDKNAGVIIMHNARVPLLTLC